MKNIILLFLSAGLLTALFVMGCSDLKDTLPGPVQSPGVHPEGWLTKTSTDFHGGAIRDLGWDMRSCKTCHGGSYSGGTSGVSCRSCHTEILGPEHCNVCHGSGSNSAPPRDLDGNTAGTFRGVGEHQVHLLGTARTAAVGCSDCHVLPSGNIYDTAHIDANPGEAEVTLIGGLASRATAGVTPVPVYQVSSGTCSNTYCHGAFKNGNGTNPMFWNGGAALSAACGSCHGNVSAPTLAERALPKTAAQGGTHPNNLACSTCHGGVVNTSLGFVNPNKHVDGFLNLNGQDRDF
ncbi:MAG: CxxxxCH/CxxCH domain-containing protein [Bacteroidota bacterium]